MTYSVIYSAAAERDIHDIYSHLLDVGSSEIANNVIAQFLYAAETLAIRSFSRCHFFWVRTIDGGGAEQERDVKSEKPLHCFDLFTSVHA